MSLPCNLNAEQILQLINQKYISLDQEEIEKNNIILSNILHELTDNMKLLDPLFKQLYEKVKFGGSYYCGLKVEKPDEYDIDLVLTLPKQCDSCGRKNCNCLKIIASDEDPGWIKLHIQEGFCKPLDKYINNGDLQTNLIKNWMKSLVQRSLNKMNKNIELSESGPAITLILHDSYDDSISVDLVPSFKFPCEKWPYNFRPNIEQFYLVPKSPIGNKYFLWRPSLQDQENEIIKGKEKLKPALRLLKKMRSSMERTQISSYYLKTIALENSEIIKPNFTLTKAFNLLLDRYIDCLHKRTLHYYWHERANLLKDIKEDVLSEHYNQLVRRNNMLKKNYSTDPLIIAKIILTKPEYDKFEDDVCNGEVPDSDAPSLDNGNTNLWLGLGVGLGVAAIGGILYAAFRNKNEDNNRNQQNNNT